MKSIKKDVMKYSPFLRLYMEHLVDLIQNLQRAVRCVLKRGVCFFFFFALCNRRRFHPLLVMLLERLHSNSSQSDYLFLE